MNFIILHLQLKNDMGNFMRYQMFGGSIKLKKDAIPHILDCQPNRTAAVFSKLPRPEF